MVENEKQQIIRTWIERLQEELSALYGRIEDLGSTISQGQEALECSDEMWELLVQQHDVMKAYASILVKRLNLITGG